ncbi:c-type cytochrome [Roseicyclus persicicus]|uniref:C-type cytochrome n=1 Tax=Roseicyclus persicicus TaxID=2650661 RepID=A0A7X6GZ66_9RHOB|nr:c-type cytochrome [Roseibacterium persicicum]NKX45048.1 c-type cytochrome [Roseibacterium persicicum]
MSRKIVLAAAATLLSAPMAMADAHAASGDAAAGERLFNQCVACHVVQNEAGDTLAGRNARTGPNLYGVAGEVFGTGDDFRWSPGMQALNAAGIMITEETFTAYVLDPTGYIREATGDNSLRGAMSFRVRSEEDAVNLYAYLASLAAE